MDVEDLLILTVHIMMVIGLMGNKMDLESLGIQRQG